MRLAVTHSTCYDYSPPVENAQHLAYLTPMNTHVQSLLSHSLEIDPLPVRQESARDVFGNTRHFFELSGAHPRLCVSARSEVLTQTPSQVQSNVRWEDVREQFGFAAGRHYAKALEFVFASPFVPWHEEFTAYASGSFTAGRALMDAACELMQRIHHDFNYESQSTQINTPALEAFHARKGVCQDFSHIMLACLRSVGVSARYVSGYLLTMPPPGQPRLVGADASHAWLSVYLPDLPGADSGSGWYDLDPTNNRSGWGSPGEDYVSVATGRDFGDVSPLRGVIHGGANHVLKVGVDVEPLAE